MTIDKALEEIGREDELKKLKIFKERVERDLEESKSKEKKLLEQLADYETKLKESSSNLQTEVIRAHLQGLLNFWPDRNLKSKEDEAVIQFIAHPEFLDIYENALMIKNPMQRVEYVLIKGNKNGSLNWSIDSTKFLAQLSPLGLSVSCPYFDCRSDVNNVLDATLDKCLIEGEPGIDAACQGKYYICRVFQEDTRKFVTGEIPYVAPPRTFKSPKIVVSEEERERREWAVLDEIKKYREED